MKYQIKNISGHQTAKVIAVIMALISSIFVLFSLFIFMVTAPEEALGIGIPMLIILPLIYLAIGYVIVRIFVFIYNKVALKTGGIEFELSRDELQE